MEQKMSDNYEMESICSHKKVCMVLGNKGLDYYLVEEALP